MKLVIFIWGISVIKDDLFISDQVDGGNLYRNMEFQANSFASCLLLPMPVLLKKIFEVKARYGIPTHRYIVYVDNQPCNIKDYNILMNELIGHFQVSKTAIEIRLKKLNFLTDNQKAEGGFIYRT